MSAEEPRCRGSPGGRVHVHPSNGSRDLRDAFARGDGAGVLFLGAARPDAPLGPELGYWRELTYFAPHLRVLIAHPSSIPSRERKKPPARRVDASDVVITTYETVTRTARLLERGWRCAV